MHTQTRVKLAFPEPCAILINIDWSQEQKICFKLQSFCNCYHNYYYIWVDLCFCFEDYFTNVNFARVSSAEYFK